MGIAKDYKNYIPEEYFQLAEAAEFHYEFHDGEIFAMAGGSLNHGIISANIITALNNALDEGDCTVTTSDVRLEIVSEKSYVHLDAMVICGEPDFAENRRDTIRNPVLIVKVLSDSTAGYDWGEKFRKYRTLGSFKEYLLVAQDRKVVDRVFKNAKGEWIIAESEGQDVVQLSSLGIGIPLEAIYRKVKFENDAG